MRKFLTAGFAALLLALVPFSAQAIGVVTSSETSVAQVFDAAGETSTTLTADAGSVLSVFISGTYANDGTLILQREVGSFGSGSFQTIATLDIGTANARVASIGEWEVGPAKRNYRMVMTTAVGSGGVSAYLTDAPLTPRDWATDADQIVFYDDFFVTGVASATVLDANVYVTQTANTNAGTIFAVTPAVEEGAGTMVSGTDTGADAATCLSAITEAAYGALVSDGWTVIEARLQVDSVAGVAAFGLVDTTCIADNLVLADIDSGTVDKLAAGSATLVAFWQQDEATNTASWQALSAVTDSTEGAQALEVPMATLVINTYDLLRIEIDELANAYFYINNNLLHAEAIATATTARLIPFFQVNDTTDGDAVVTMIIDYLMFVVPRPPA